MWQTNLGERVLCGPERAVVRGAVHAVLDQLDLSLTAKGCRRPEWGIDLFDRLEPEPQVALLAVVVQALFDPAAAPPRRTAVNEAAVAVLFATIQECVAGEIELEDASPRVRRNRFLWRQRLRACFDEQERANLGFAVPPATSRDPFPWAELVARLAERVLWDEDWEAERMIMDADPETARQHKARRGIPEDYYTAIAPDPTPSELRRAWDLLCTTL